LHVLNIFFMTPLYLLIPSLQLRLITSLFSNLDSKLKTNSQYLSIDQCRVLVLICSHILLRKTNSFSCRFRFNCVNLQPNCHRLTYQNCIVYYNVCPYVPFALKIN
jgi:hypothetical protein